MTNENTYELILSTFIDMLEKESLEKINVKKLCEACGINRNTFYYHFADLMDVLDHIFKREIRQILSEPLTSIQEEYRLRASMLYKYKKIILHIYRSKDPGILYKYLDTVTVDLVHKYVAAASADKADNIGDICHMYELTLKGLMLDWLKSGMPEPDEKSGEKFASFFEASLPALIDTL